MDVLYIKNFDSINEVSIELDCLKLFLEENKILVNSVVKFFKIFSDIHTEKCKKEEFSSLLQKYSVNNITTETTLELVLNKYTIFKFENNILKNNRKEDSLHYKSEDYITENSLDMEIDYWNRRIDYYNIKIENYFDTPSRYFSRPKMDSLHSQLAYVKEKHALFLSVKDKANHYIHSIEPHVL